MVTIAVAILMASVTLVSAGRSSSLSAKGETDYCYAWDNNPYINFSSKTAYEFVYNKEGISNITGCRAAQVWLVCRHGTRFPSLKHFKTLRALEQLRDRILKNGSGLCAEDLDNLRRWAFDVPDEAAKQLTDQGRADLVGLGRRIALYFPHLFRQGYNEHTHIFRHTDTPRTAESAIRFAEGAFGGESIGRLPPPVNGTDPLLNPYEHCKAWRALEEPKRQDRRFKKSRSMQEVVDRVGRRLGLPKAQLKTAQVFSMYDGCRYQKAWNVSEVSPWCAVFNKKDLEVLEYRGDLREYYKSGPGSDINLRLACPMLQDMVNNFRDVQTSGVDAPSALLYFAHDWTLQMLAARLGLTSADDRPIGVDADAWPNRRFRTSSTVPFAANIMAVLYNCTQGDLKVGIYHQEHLVKLPGCKESFCDLQQFAEMFEPLTNNRACTDMSFCTKSGGKVKE